MKIKQLFLMAAFGLMATASLTSCEDILGEWSKPAPATVTPAASVTALFSVSADTKVIFSPGNLQYNSSEATYKWRFAEHQYDYVGAWDTSTWVDLFGWGTWTGDASNPINESTTAGDYSWADADFNQESKLADESQRGYDWRTLTGGADGEWKYLLDSRTTATTNMPDGTNNSEARYTKATVAGVSGIILFPDNYAHPAGVTVTVSEAAYNTSNKAYNTFNVDATNWSTMETAGCVFLPAAGYRNGTTMNNAGSLGYYWSSTVDDANYAFNVYFGSGSLDPAVNGLRNNGFSVRLVRPAE